MKIFAIYSNIYLTNKPDWLDEFRKKYDKPYEFHITLKQPCYVEEDKIPELKEIVLNFINSSTISSKTIEIIFNEVVFDKDEEGTTIMIKANNESLTQIQKNLCASLLDYTDYVKPKYKNYEENFVPHITIARNLSEAQEGEAIKYLQNGFLWGGEINSFVLSVVSENTPEEAKNPANQNLYYF